MLWWWEGMARRGPGERGDWGSVATEDTEAVLAGFVGGQPAGGQGTGGRKDDRLLDRTGVCRPGTGCAGTRYMTCCTGRCLGVAGGGLSDFWGVPGTGFQEGRQVGVWGAGVGLAGGRRIMRRAIDGFPQEA